MTMTKATHIWLIRHGETEWSLSGAHTSRTDIPLTQKGRERASVIHSYLENKEFSLVLSSPRQRALETARIAGFGEAAFVDENLIEWDYGEYEGRTTAEIRKDLKNPRWTVWDGAPPGSEPLDSVAERARNVISRALQAGGDVVMFSHAHFLRILAATWIGLPPAGGRLFSLGTGAISRLGFERETRVIELWNLSFEDETPRER